MIDALEAFSRREEGWIQALNKDDYTDAVIQGVEAVSKAMESYNLLEHLSCDYYSKLAVTGKKLLEMKLDSIVKETIADFSKGLPPSYAYSMLEPIMNGKARGDVKRELNKSLAILAMKREKKEEKEYLDLEESKMETVKCVRTSISLEQLFKLDNDLLEEYDLYVKEGMVEFDKNTIVYLDDPLDVDDDTEDEIYPNFAQEHDLQWLFSGQVINDIIVNTQHQLPNPTVKDYIKNLIYYNENDCFFTFK
ncbi:DUF7716 domain-containing protein [Anaerocolumna cellulosilytica]|uniref:DUF7716 domain-containing protein n=1 Tax=Anaerocolumna cellulosilytica TaxID=433286 RepID=UPI001611B5AF|nr:hypothetical protein [Anaerocolumna cellulosilytica]MBB5195536.1 hypothetical protein [Anaerocolumna cellulosilytica]